MDRKAASSVHPGIASNRVPSSPHTPQRATSSTFSSPSTSFRQEEDAVVIELGARYLRAGFEGESTPQCCLTFGPSDSRRVGDYRDWLQSYAETPNVLRRGEEWGSDHELWRMDVRNVDLGLVEDKLDRAVREAYTKHLLTDPGSQRLILVLPSVVPHQLLETIFVTLFSHFRYHGITLLQQPAMCVVAAGLRSGLVVDVGWDEAIVTAIYEYRECHSRRSVRGMKLLTHEMGRLLNKLGKDNDKKEQGFEGDEEKEKFRKHVTLDYCEEVTTRLAWCRQWSSNRASAADQLRSLSLSDDQCAGTEANGRAAEMVSIPLSPVPSSELVKVPLQNLSDPVEKAFFAGGPLIRDSDDNEYSLPVLVYYTLLALPPDVRGTCMSRIIVTGGGSKIPGLKKRLVDELAALIDQFGWDPIRGKARDTQRERLKEMSRNRQTAQTVPAGPTTANKSATQQGKDIIEEKLRRNQSKDAPSVHGVLRQVESLGAWAGASLVASLRVKGLVEIERDKFLQHGLAGASRDAEVSVHPPRLSLGGVQKAGVGDRSSWTLGAWA